MRKKQPPIHEWYTLAISEGDGFLYINPNEMYDEPGIDRYTFSTFKEAREYRDHYCDTPEAIMILRETRQLIEEDDEK